MSQPPTDQPADRHPGDGPTPPAAASGQPPFPPQSPDQAAPAGATPYPPYGAPDQTAPAGTTPYPPYGAPGQPAPGGYAPQQQPHPGYGPTPPAAAPRHPGYGPTPPGAPGASAAHQPGTAANRNPLGLAALVLGAVGPVLGFLFIFIQAGVFVTGGTGAIGAISAAQSVLVGLSALAAVILGLVAISKPGSPKALASAGLALGAASLLGVVGSLLYPVIISAMYG